MPETTEQPGSLGGLTEGENPYAITNDDPRVPDTVALLQSWGCPRTVTYHEQAGVPAPVYTTHFIRDGAEDTDNDSSDVYVSTSGMMVQNPTVAFGEMTTRGMVNTALATSAPSSSYGGRPQ